MPPPRLERRRSAVPSTAEPVKTSSSASALIVIASFPEELLPYPILLRTTRLIRRNGNGFPRYGRNLLVYLRADVPPQEAAEHVTKRVEGPVPAHHVVEPDRRDSERVGDRIERRERHGHDGGGRRHPEENSREHALDALQHGRERKERDGRRSCGEDRGGRRLDRPDASDAERDERGANNHERCRANVHSPESGVCGAKLTADETHEDRRDESAVMEMDRREQRNVLGEVHDRDPGAPQDDPPTTDGEAHEADRDAELLDAPACTEGPRQAV